MDGSLGGPVRPHPSAETAAKLQYLEQNVVAEVADIIESNKLRSLFDSDPHHLSPD